MATTNNRGRGATRRANQSGLPAWGLFTAGFLAGCFFSFLIYLGGVEEKPERPVAEKKPTPEQPDSTATKFDFFTLLPEREVIVPEEETVAKNKAEKEADVKAQDTSKPRKPEEPAVQYILQAGSFKNGEDADRRRAELLLLGMEAKVEAVRANGDTWHRVYVGPFASSTTVSKARSTLMSEGIDTLLLRRKTEAG